MKDVKDKADRRVSVLTPEQRRRSILKSATSRAQPKYGVAVGYQAPPVKKITLPKMPWDKDDERP